MIHDTQRQISQKQNEHNMSVIMKTMCPPGYHHNGFVATHALGNIMYGYSLLVPMNQRVLNELSKEHWYQQCLQFNQLFGSLEPAMCNRTLRVQVHELPQSHCGDNREGTLFS